MVTASTEKISKKPKFKIFKYPGGLTNENAVRALLEIKSHLGKKPQNFAIDLSNAALFGSGLINLVAYAVRNINQIGGRVVLFNITDPAREVLNQIHLAAHFSALYRTEKDFYNALNLAA